MIKFTLHDIFGYLLPGIITLAALTVLSWSFCFPSHELSLSWLADQKWPFFALVLLLAYFLGHVVACIAAMSMHYGTMEDSLPTNVADSIKLKAGDILGTRYDKASDSKAQDLLNAICDNYNLRHDKQPYREIREMLLYRIDFCRGLTVSFLVLAFSFMARSVIPGGGFELGHVKKDLNWPVVLTVIVLSLIGSSVSYVRFRRFRRLRLTQIAAAFLVLQHERAPKYPPENADPKPPEKPNPCREE
ncbi:MAG TPA: hypothetical protein VM163_09290 [bacterium]|nr:hypothetical protein [bacterium]